MDYKVKLSQDINSEYIISEDSPLVIGVNGVNHKFPIIKLLTSEMALQFAGNTNSKISLIVDIIPDKIPLPPGYRFITRSGSYVLIGGAFAITNAT